MRRTGATRVGSDRGASSRTRGRCDGRASHGTGRTHGAAGHTGVHTSSPVDRGAAASAPPRGRSHARAHPGSTAAPGRGCAGGADDSRRPEVAAAAALSAQPPVRPGTRPAGPPHAPSPCRAPPHGPPGQVATHPEHPRGDVAPRAERAGCVQQGLINDCQPAGRRSSRAIRSTKPWSATVPMAGARLTQGRSRAGPWA